MLKTEYREYIASPDWQARRREFLLENTQCARCEIPRWLAEIAYDQDLNVHHLSYVNLGDESSTDLEALCRRCHEIEKFGRSDLREPKTVICEMCDEKHWNPYTSLCVECENAAKFVVCRICRRSYVSLREGIAFSDTCGMCKDLLAGNLDGIWNCCDATFPLLNSLTFKDLMLISITAKYGIDSVLDSLVQLEEYADFIRSQELKRQQRTDFKDLTDDDIPF